MPLKPAEPLRAMALLAGAGLCAVVANSLSPAQRRLVWTGWVPPAALQAPPQPVPIAMASPEPAPEPAVARRVAQPAPPRFAPSPEAASREISSQDAWAAFQLKLPFLDARRSEEFASGHVRGAHSVPVWEADLDKRLTVFEATVNPGPKDPIVIYCGGGGCEDSHLLARKLVTLGYRNLLIYRDGFPDWLAQGRPQAAGGPS